MAAEDDLVWMQAEARGVACQILDVLKNAMEPMTARHIGEMAGLDRTVAYRFLCSLRSGGLAREAGDKWQLDVGALDMRFAYWNGLLFPSQANLMCGENAVPSCGARERTHARQLGSRDTMGQDPEREGQ
ncbi:transcriptional regulator (plasmid) [Mycobacterium sp. JS623]|jgi:IclR helix-turn-helix domain|uniref:helix-turn-helix domain-containing protein n=1 Tax=Mycobacterium sp. JS623 TaxID=212767 RepID=UPI0002A57C1A|nr:helix-turn-helix domain-containing protein [Mycobacterium sp. JS623]AGB26755.1 transcriptional regulator [Mycobacterium sp. JS623]